MGLKSSELTLEDIFLQLTNDTFKQPSKATTDEADEPNFEGLEEGFEQEAVVVDDEQDKGVANDEQEEQA